MGGLFSVVPPQGNMSHKLYLRESLFYNTYN